MSARVGRILVVDDDDAGRYVKAHILGGSGYIVSQAALGHAAIEQIAIEPPDLVVLDVRLPDIDGVSVCRQIKDGSPQIIVLQTSSALIGAAERTAALESGADSFLVEPFEPAELIAVVRALLRMRAAEQELRQLNNTLEARVAERARELAIANRSLESERAERRLAEETLWHTQKLEAVGRLTGGIAHDFNNLLTIITGNLELLHDAVEGGRKMAPERMLRLVATAEGAAEQGAKVTKQLLAFARRSVLRQETVSLNAVIAGFEDFLHRTLGETIALDLAYAPDLWPCRIDLLQFEAALLNLAVNARDAMPGGGRLGVQTENVDVAPAIGEDGEALEPGPYACVRVRDSGFGMTADVARRAFEPFFTTKEVGQGSGLGLSQVYGFVKQSGGHVTIDTSRPSEKNPRSGTTFSLYLPRSDQRAQSRLSPLEAGAERPTGGETILVVEDNEGVRGVAVAMIEDLGYRVLVAEDGVAALELIRGEPAIDLVFSDIVMPRGVDGFVLAQQARALRDGIRTLLTSGYPAMRGRDAGAVEMPILLKPYRRDELARQIRWALDAPPAGTLVGDTWEERPGDTPAPRE